MGTYNLSGISSTTSSNLNKYGSGYKKREDVIAAENYLNQVQQNKPGEFSSQYTQQMNDMYDQVMNRKKFQYDLNGDMLYNQYKDQYQALGKTAMADTMGQAAALTGGYGSSYAETAGMQAYQGYLQELNNQVPQLYQIARDTYNQEGDQLLNKYNLSKDMYNTDYSKYRDTVSDWQTERSYASDDYYKKQSQDYSEYKDMLNYWADVAAKENSNYWNQTNFNYQKQQDALQYALQKEQLALQKAKAFSSGSGGGTSNNSSKKTTSKIGSGYAKNLTEAGKTAERQLGNIGMKGGGKTAMSEYIKNRVKNENDRKILYAKYIGS